jgi:Zn-dependent protease with chaperone function
MLLAYLSQSILHALVAAVFVEALLRVWRVEDGAWRIRFRLLALAVPVVWLPLLLLFAPFRNGAVFIARWALFAGERWNQIRIAGAGLGDLVLLLAAGLGSALFLRDALPPLADLLRGTSPMPDAGPSHTIEAGLRAVARRHADALGIAMPGIRVVRTTTPVLLCEGARRPVLVVSPATLGRLQGAELDVAVAHELAHAAHRDPALGYLLIAVRAILFFNPAAQWTARALVDDIERRADQVAVGLTGDAAALIRVMTILFDSGHPPPVDGDASFERVFWRIRKQGVERRCERLEQSGVVAPLDRAPTLMAMAAIGVLALVFFVV